MLKDVLIHVGTSSWTILEDDIFVHALDAPCSHENVGFLGN